MTQITVTEGRTLVVEITNIICTVEELETTLQYIRGKTGANKSNLTSCLDKMDRRGDYYSIELKLPGPRIFNDDDLITWLHECGQVGWSASSTIL